MHFKNNVDVVMGMFATAFGSVGYTISNSEKLQIVFLILTIISLVITIADKIIKWLIKIIKKVEKAYEDGKLTIDEISSIYDSAREEANEIVQSAEAQALADRLKSTKERSEK